MPLITPMAAGPVTLVVAWRTGVNVHGRTVKIGGEVAESLRQIGSRSVDVISGSSGRAYDPDDAQEEAPYITALRDELWDTQLMQVLESGASLSSADADDLSTKKFACYAAVFGEGEKQTIFVRKTNPISLATKPMLAGLVDGTLTKLHSPLFAFDNFFDVIITRDQVYALNQGNFELLFKESEAVLAKAPEWVVQLSKHVPFNDDGRVFLEESLRKSSVYRRKVHSILRRTYIELLTPELLKQQMKKHGLDVERLMPEDELIFSAENVRELIRLLNEDYFQGDFSEERYAAGTKQRLGA